MKTKKHLSFGKKNYLDCKTSVFAKKPMSFFKLFCKSILILILTSFVMLFAVHIYGTKDQIFRGDMHPAAGTLRTTWVHFDKVLDMASKDYDIKTLLINGEPINIVNEENFDGLNSLKSFNAKNSDTFFIVSSPDGKFSEKIDFGKMLPEKSKYFITTPNIMTTRLGIYTVNEWGSEYFYFERFMHWQKVRNKFWFF